MSLNYKKISQGITPNVLETMIDKSISVAVIEAAKAAIKVEAVDELPEVGEEKVIYLVSEDTSEEGNLFSEYLWVNGAWERFGSTKIDLSFLEGGNDGDVLTKVKNGDEESVEWKPTSGGSDLPSTDNANDGDVLTVNKRESGGTVIDPNTEYTKLYVNADADINEVFEKLDQLQYITGEDITPMYIANVGFALTNSNWVMPSLDSIYIFVNGSGGVLGYIAKGGTSIPDFVLGYTLTFDVDGVYNANGVLLHGIIEYDLDDMSEGLPMGEQNELLTCIFSSTPDGVSIEWKPVSSGGSDIPEFTPDNNNNVLTAVYQKDTSFLDDHTETFNKIYLDKDINRQYVREVLDSAPIEEDHSLIVVFNNGLAVCISALTFSVQVGTFSNDRFDYMLTLWSENQGFSDQLLSDELGMYMIFDTPISVVEITDMQEML